jgi:beta-glucanase (GH16 family)
MGASTSLSAPRVTSGRQSDTSGQITAPDEIHVNLPDDVMAPAPEPELLSTALSAPSQIVHPTAVSRSQPAVVITAPAGANVDLAKTFSNIVGTLSQAVTGSAATPAGGTRDAVTPFRSAAPAVVAPGTTVTAPVAAATSSSTTPVVEAEKMTVARKGTARVVSDSTASGRSAMAFVGSGSVSTTVTIVKSTALTIRARAGAGAPNMTVAIDGKPITTVVVGSTSYGDYTFAGTIPAGKHVITVSTANATSTQMLYLDKLSTSTGAISDHFAGTAGSAANSAYWTTIRGTGWDPGIQNYTTGGAYLDGNSRLVIKATRGADGSWTSGRIESANKLSYGYGTITARIKVPKGQGLWPAFWLTGADAATNGWPATGEIDVMELPSTTTTMYSTLHGPISGTTATQQAQIISTLPDLSTDYHNYWVKHLPNQITFGLDGQTLGTLTPADLAPGETWVYNRPMYVLLNLAVGGSWAGAPDSTTPSTAEMLVDSVTFVPA